MDRFRNLKATTDRVMRKGRYTEVVARALKEAVEVRLNYNPL